MKVLFGYLTSFGYLFAVILLCGFLQKRKVISGELSRKAIHILIFFTWCLMDIFWGISYHQIIICAVFVAINYLSYRYKFLAGVERADKSHAGTVYYAMAMLTLSIAAYFYHPLYYPFGAAVFALSFGDGVAPIFGKIKRGNLSLTSVKTLFGTLSCFIFASLALMAFNYIYSLDLGVLSIFAIGGIAALSELFAVKGLDNFSLTFIVAAFVLAASFEVFTAAFWVCALLSFGVTLVALSFKSLTTGAAFVAEMMMLISAYCADWSAFAVYVIPFAAIAIIGLFKKKAKGMEIKGEKKGRGVKQVLINGLPALVCFVLYKALSVDAFFVGGAGALCACFSDSCASDVGSFSTKEPYDIFRRKRVQKGISGGVSLLGNIACFSGAALLSASAMIARPLSFAPLVIFVSGVSGCFFDTFLGSLFQALYCYRIPIEPDERGVVQKYGYVETPLLYEECVLVKGCKYITNNTVNLLSGVFGAILASMVYYLVF